MTGPSPFNSATHELTMQLGGCGQDVLPKAYRHASGIVSAPANPVAERVPVGKRGAFEITSAGSTPAIVVIGKTTMNEPQAAATWLRELGAIRPMAVAADVVLVLGTFREGRYPIQYRKFRDRLGQSGDWIEQWYVLGILTAHPLTREDCEWLLKQIP